MRVEKPMPFEFRVRENLSHKWVGWSIVLYIGWLVGILEVSRWDAREQGGDPLKAVQVAMIYVLIVDITTIGMERQGATIQIV